MNKIKYNYDLLDGFCEENKITLTKDYSAEKLNRDYKIDGKCIQEGCCETFNRCFGQLYKVNGYCKNHINEHKQTKRKESCLKKYGVEHISQNEEMKKQKLEKCLEKYGVKCSLQNEEVKNKIKETRLEKYGFENASQYNYNLLNSFCKENKITLTKNYSEEKINRKTRIEGKCVQEGCCGTFNKIFIQIYKNNGMYCKIHTLQQRKEKLKKTSLEKYGVEHPLKNKEIQNKRKETCLEKYGGHPLQNTEIRNKIKETCLEKYGTNCPLQNEEIQNKVKKTCMENYGVENPFQNEDIKNKIKETCLEKYGAEYACQNKNVRNKFKETCLEKYGVENPSQNEEVKNKKIETSLKNYGVEYHFQNEDIKNKIKETCLEKYGAEHFLTLYRPDC